MLALFTGDSITDAGRRADPSGFLGAGYVRRIAGLAEASHPGLRVVNTGISGNRAVDLVDRWTRDVLDHQPDILTILIGANDMWRRFDADSPTSADEFRSHYETLLDRARAETSLRHLVLMDPFVVPVNEEQESWHETDLAAKIDVVGELARRHGAIHLPLHDILTERAAQDGPLSVVEDGIHPTAAGHELIARTWWRAVDPLVDATTDDETGDRR